MCVDVMDFPLFFLFFFFFLFAVVFLFGVSFVLCRIWLHYNENLLLFKRTLVGRPNNKYL